FSAANLHIGSSGNPRFSFVKNQGFAAAAASGCVPASENCPLNSLQVASGNVPDLFFTASKNVPGPFSAASGSVPELTFLPREACQSSLFYLGKRARVHFSASGSVPRTAILTGIQMHQVIY